ncbi:hypothetical protein [Hanstruepera marina]|uniref:hypothetical protein n=1 Tax=Hanstruepera marina TaxID=2873265 RepID=UPI001CA614DE|nr:hypothetical protein [Hanstruepera marina]
MRLSEEHIENLYAFTRKHFVEYYDLQTELVDHMANDIEVILEDNPNLSFEQARDKAFKKFGVFGFMEVVEQRHKAMNKKYAKLLWHYAKDWFRLPQIIFTIIMFSSFFILFSYEIGGYVFFVAYFIFCTFLVFKTIRINRKIKQKRKAKEKLWLLEDIILRSASVGSLIFMPQLFNLLNGLDSLGKTKPLLYASLFSILIIYTYVSTVVLPNNATKHLKETYPEYSL